MISATRTRASNRRSTMALAHCSVSPSSPTVVVAGGGIVGVSTVFFLAAEQTNLRPVVIDATSVAASASGKAGGFLAESWSDGSATEELARKGFALHQSWSETDTFGDVDYRFNIDAESGLLGSSERRYIGSTRRACGQVHPRKLTTRLAEQVVAMGGEVRAQTMLVGVVLEDDVEQGDRKRVVGVRVRKTDDEEAAEETIATTKVVLALGAWTSVTLKTACSAAYAAVGPEVAGHKVHSLVVADTREEGLDGPESTSLFLRDMLVSRGADPEAYPRPDGTIYVCGNQAGAVYDETPPRLASEVGVEEDGAAGYLRQVSAVLVGGEAEDVDVVEAQACYLPTSSSNRPLISAVPNIDGLYVNAGHSCWGILQGPISGKAIAELVATGVY